MSKKSMSYKRGAKPLEYLDKNHVMNRTFASAISHILAERNVICLKNCREMTVL